LSRELECDAAAFQTCLCIKSSTASNFVEGLGLQLRRGFGRISKKISL